MWHFWLWRAASIGLWFCANALAGTSVVERTASLTSLFPAEEVERFASILPGEQRVRWQVYAPDIANAPGALVFVSPTRSGTPPQDWIEVLKQRNLVYVAADDFGNPKPIAQRILVGLMGLALVQREFGIDAKRTYIVGMSGGGRVASHAITKFPQLFSGALYIVGVDFWKVEESLVPLIISKRYVFLTGSKDFNRRETKQVYEKYRAAGAQRVLLMDLPGYGHENPTAAQLDEALAFLDGT